MQNTKGAQEFAFECEGQQIILGSHILSSCPWHPAACENSDALEESKSASLPPSHAEGFGEHTYEANSTQSSNPSFIFDQA